MLCYLIRTESYACTLKRSLTTLAGHACGMQDRSVLLGVWTLERLEKCTALSSGRSIRAKVNAIIWYLLPRLMSFLVSTWDISCPGTEPLGCHRVKSPGYGRIPQGFGRSCRSTRLSEMRTLVGCDSYIVRNMSEESEH